MTNLEREIKLEPSSVFTLDALAARGAGGLRASRPVAHRLHTTYYDTDDLRLLRWDCNLRYRAGHGWMVKLPETSTADSLSRREVTFEGSAGSIPAAALDLVSAYPRGKPLRRAVELRTLRSTLMLSNADRNVAEVDDDHVHVIGGPADGFSFRQVEIELLTEDAPNILRSLKRDVCRVAKMRDDPTPKIVRALGLAASPSREFATPELSKRSTAFDVLRSGLAKSGDVLFRSDPAIRAGGHGETIHHARTAVRRIRSDLQTFAPLLDEPWARNLMDELRWLGSELGAARDAEVLLERLRGRVATLSAEDARNAQPILDAHAAQEHEGRERLLAAMREPRYYALLDALVESIPHPLFADAGRSKALRVMPRLMRRAWKSVRKLVRKVDGTPTNRELHDIRIKAKRARYAAEMFAQIAPARRFATRMESLQLELGEHHDAVVVQQRLRHFRHDPSLAFAAGLITAKESAIAERVRRKWRSTLRKAEREGCTFWE